MDLRLAPQRSVLASAVGQATSVAAGDVIFLKALAEREITAPHVARRARPLPRVPENDRPGRTWPAGGEPGVPGRPGAGASRGEDRPAVRVDRGEDAVPLVRGGDG